MTGPLKASGLLVRPSIPNACVHNGHLYYVMIEQERRVAMLDLFKKEQIGAPFHYVPLHSSPGGRRYGRVHGTMMVTDRAAQSLLRLPLSSGLTEA